MAAIGAEPSQVILGVGQARSKYRSPQVTHRLHDRDTPLPQPLPLARERGTDFAASTLPRTGDDVGAADIRAAQRLGEGEPGTDAAFLGVTT